MTRGATKDTPAPFPEFEHVSDAFLYSTYAVIVTFDTAEAAEGFARSTVAAVLKRPANEKA